MQFFLAPRQVLNCGSADCVRQLDPHNTYLLVVEDFPGEPAPAGFGAAQMYNHKWGFLPPEDGDLAPRPPAPVEFVSYTGLLLAALPPALWLALLALSGAVWAAWLLPLAGRGMHLGLGYGLGLAVFTVGMALISLAGIPLTRFALLALSGVMYAGAAVRLAWLRPKNIVKVGQKGSRALSHLGFGLLILALGGCAALLGVGRGYSVSDEILLWGAKGYGIAASSGIQDVMVWGTNTVKYPLHLPLLIAAFKILFAEALPASKLLPAGYLTALLLVMYAFLSRSGLRRDWAGMLVMLVGTAPLVARHAALNYANLPLGYYLVCAALLLVLGLRQVGASSLRLCLAAGLVLACAAWTRPEGLGFAWLVAAVLLVSGFRRRSLRPVLFVLAPLLIYSLFWIILAALVYTRPAGQSGLAAQALGRFLAGEWHLGEAVYLGRQFAVHLMNTGAWGLLGVGMVLAWLLAALKPRWFPRLARWLLGSGAFYALAVLGGYFLASYDTSHDLSWWISTGLDRMLLPAVLLSGLGAAAWLKQLDHGVNRSRPLDSV